MDPLSALRLSAAPDLRNLRTAAVSLPADARKLAGAELESLNSTFPLQAPAAVGPPHSFDSMLTELVDQVIAKQAAASQSASALQAGQNVSLHQTMIAMEEASVSFQLMVEVRNKLVESYQELMRMQV